ncbi:alpha/beta fold hydrolase [Deinococcus arenicola]|uniref:Alpha/beta fold hydrolase n=1 Tax=Deinococcus arenicola TaxID=2994950 RepID=A0ABU4DUV2_9DEIO|nr:alpha/beta fold hydrolase [Deinococcus sp. ZS9-10]MDV6376218.1 alpha/beta fold hydrolase [Deinococcus sp. ZS9-10]
MIVPGLGCASWMYLRLAHLLAQKYTVWLYDPPGQGLSQGRWNDAVSVEQLTDHLALWLQTQQISRPLLLGHSLGGEVVIELAVRYPQFTGPLIAVAPTGLPENPSLFRQVWRLIRDIPRERLGFWPLCLSAYIRAGIWRCYQLARAIEHQSALPDLALIPHPVLLLGGARDPVVHVSALRQISWRWPHVQVRELAGAPHGMTDADAAEVAAQVWQWVDSLKRTGEAE